jgi:hypothetical protein
VRGSTWTVVDVAAHVATVADRYVGYLYGTVAPVVHVHTLNRDNAANLAAFHERAVTALAARIRDAGEAFLDATSELGIVHPMRWHDVPATIGTVYGIYLGELLVHGRDIARTLGRSWPISRTDAIIIFEGMVSVGQWFVVPPERPTACSRSTFATDRATPSRSWEARSTSNQTESEDPIAASGQTRGHSHSCSTGRLSQCRAILRGQLIAGGRRPWRALTFPARFGGFEDSRRTSKHSDWQLRAITPMGV